MIETSTFKGLEMLMVFGGIFALCVHQLWSLRREARLRAARDAEARSRGDEEPMSTIPAWMQDRSRTGRKP